MKMGDAVRGYMIAKVAEGYADSTLHSYQLRLNRLDKWLDHPDIQDITTNNLRDYFYYLRKEYTPDRPDGDTSPLTESSIHGHWRAFRSFWRWAAEELGYSNIALGIPAPKYTNRPIIPFTKEDIILLLHSCEQDAAGHKRQTSIRDRAIILFLLDTGLRRGEFLRLKVGDVDLDNGQVVIKPYGRGRKTSGRIVYIGNKARVSMWKYYSTFAEPRHGDEKLWDLKPDALQNLVRRMGERCGVHAHSHRFRHTFAINFLRNGGNVFELQRLLGHNTLDMVRHYLNIAESDTEDAHRRASPVDMWKL